MSFDVRKREYSRFHIDIVEIDLEYCSLTFGVLPCTASGSGDAKCFNTNHTCQDLENYDDNLATPTVKTYRFCDATSPQPLGIDLIPSMKSLSISPAVIDIKGGLGIRSNVSISFNDHTSSDIDIDKELSGRTYNPLDRGTYWTKLRARNPNYQNRELRVLSGYLVDGTFDASNFTTRYYIIDKLNATKGSASITGKDPLKLASNKKAQAPAPSTGQAQLAISDSETSVTLIPTGVGNLEYSASGHCLIGKEVISFMRSGDILTLTRAQYNTVATTHNANDTIQECLVYNDQVDEIIIDLLENYANIKTAFIPSAAWGSEVDTYLSGLLAGIIVKPHDVWKLLKELSEAMPHYLWWDERSQEIQLTALKAPPLSADVLDQDENLIADSISITDMVDKRISTVVVNFGQFDPTKKLDEFGNYEQSYIRVDTDSVAKYDSSEIKTINSRWISNSNKAAALQLAALIGRRFSDIPRMINFSLDAKDSDVWIGQSVAINCDDIVDFTGVPKDTVFQLTGVKESGDYRYQGIEYTYGLALDEDEGGGDPDVDLVIFGAAQQNVNLRTIYDTLFPTPDGTTQAKFIVQNGVIIGSSSLATSMDTGSWPVGAEITLQVDTGGMVIGLGGRGQHGTGTPVAGNGSGALDLSFDLILINNGIIGGGGAGGDRDSSLGRLADGGGGAGDDVGERGGGLSTGAGAFSVTQATAGTSTSGGEGAEIEFDNAGEPQEAFAEDGGNLGQDATTATGGFAIDKNGFTLTEDVTGDIRGDIIT